MVVAGAEVVTTEETTNEITTETIVVTSTVGQPLGLARRAQALEERGSPALPSFLKSYPGWQISSACSQLVQTAIHTRTVTRTVLGGPQQKVTKTRMLWPAATFTATTTTKTTVTATKVDVVKTSTTVTTTVESTTTPVVTSTSTTTSTITETATDTTTTTICPGPLVTGANGVSVDTGDPGSAILFPATDGIVGCCSYCYYNVPDGCQLWAASGSGGPNFCFIVHGGSGPSQPGDDPAVCPRGRGGGQLFSDPSAFPDSRGGRGPCAGNVVVS